MAKNNIHTIQELFRNAKLDYGVPFQECSKVLGGPAQVGIAAGLWQEHGEMLRLIATNALLNFCETSSFTDVEVRAFKYGLGVVNGFLVKCTEEHIKNNEIAKMQQENTNSLTDEENVA